MLENDSNTHEDDIEFVDLFLRISHNMIIMPDEDAFMTSILADIGAVLGASRVYIFKYIDSLLFNTHEWVAFGVLSVQHLFQGVNHEKLMEKVGITESFVQKKAKIIKVNDVPKEVKPFFTTQNIHSAILVPFFEEDNFSGFFGIEKCEEDDEWVHKFDDIIEPLSTLINNARIHFNAKCILIEEEENARKLFDILPFPVYIIDSRNYEIVLYNKEFAAFVGDNITKSSTCHKVLFNDDAPCNACGMNNLALDGEPRTWSCHNTFYNVYLNFVETCMSWGDLKRVHVVAFMDITDALRMQREQVLERESIKTKDRFLANMTHELRTPVNGIVGMTYLAEKNNTNPTIASYLDKIKFSSKTLLTVINNILDYSKIEAGKMELECHSFNIQEVFSLIINVCQKKAEAKNIDFSFTVKEYIPKDLCADSIRILQVVQSLTENAIKFTEQGSVEVIIDAIIHQHLQRCVLCITIKDTGIGISEEYLNRLFTTFMQVDTSFSRKHGGTGIGLAVVRGLIRLMEGHIIVESELDKGSTFECFFPCQMNNTDKQNALFNDNENNIVPSLEGVQILLAEDNDINVIIAKEVLKDFGCIVDVAGNGLEVLEMLNKKEYDLVLMDMEMPILNGFEATARIRQNSRYDNLPIIAMSAHSLQEIKEIHSMDGMQGHINKPLDIETLQNELYGFLAVPKLKKTNNN